MDRPIARTRLPFGGDPRLLVAGGIAAGGLVLGLLAWAVRAAPAAIEADEDVARIGDVSSEVIATGSLEYVQTQLLTAPSPARVLAVHVAPGDSVAAGQLLISLGSPDVEIQTLQAEQALSAERSALLEYRASTAMNVLAQESAVHALRSAAILAARDSAAAEDLGARRLASEVEVLQKRSAASDARIRLEREGARLVLMRASADSLAAARREQVERLAAIAQFQRRRLDALEVRAPFAGVTQDVKLQLGEWVVGGVTLLKLVKRDALRAVLRVPESAAAVVGLGQRAVVRIGADSALGHVVGKEASASEGSVNVRVQLDGKPPAGAVAERSVQGRIIVGRRTGVVKIRRPLPEQEHGGYVMVRAKDGSLSRRPVVFGAAGATEIEVASGLAAGEVVRLSRDEGRQR